MARAFRGRYLRCQATTSLGNWQHWKHFEYFHHRTHILYEYLWIFHILILKKSDIWHKSDRHYDTTSSMEWTHSSKINFGLGLHFENYFKLIIIIHSKFWMVIYSFYEDKKNVRKNYDHKNIQAYPLYMMQESRQTIDYVTGSIYWIYFVNKSMVLFIVQIGVTYICIAGFINFPNRMVNFPHYKKIQIA